MTWTESITQFALKAVDVTMEAGGRFEAVLPAQNWKVADYSVRFL